MSPAGRLEGWQNTVLPRISQKLKLDNESSFENSADLTSAAINTFQETLATARKYHKRKTSEPPEIHHATMAHMFELIGILPLDAVRIVDELILNSE